MKRYSIGQVSNILHMPVVTLRYLEKQGLVSPMRDEQNGYRYFSLEDIQRIIDYRWYRDAGYSQADAIDALTGTDLFLLSNRMRRAAEEASEKARRKTALAQRLNSYSEKLRIDNLTTSLGEFRVLECPEMYYCVNAVESGDLNRFKDASQFEEWIDVAFEYYSFMDYVALVFYDGIVDARMDFGVTLGYAMELQWADALGINFPDNSIVIPSSTCVNTILRIPLEEPIESTVRGTILPYLAQNGFTLGGDVWGNRLAIIDEGSGPGSYFEFWAPIETQPSE